MIRRAGILVAGVALTVPFNWAVGQCFPPPPLVEFTGLGVLPTGYSSQPTAISADGLVVVGNAISVANGSVAFRWTRGGGMQSLGLLPGTTQSTAAAVNADGSLIMGDSSVGNSQYHPFRWTAATGMVDFATLPPGTLFSPRAMSADASAVAGNCGVWGQPASVWTQVDGVQPIQAYPVTDRTYSANGISADGTVLIGDPAFRWTASTGLQLLGFFQAHAVTPDGAVIVGGNYRAPGDGHFIYDVCRWSASGTSILDMPLEPDVFRDALAVSADGSVIVGVWGAHPLLWTEAMGPLDLAEYLRVLGANLSAWTLDTAVGMSADGTTFTGYGTHTYAPGQSRREAWIATTAMLLTQEPSDRVTCQGRAEAFTVRLVGTTPPFVFVWRKDGEPISNPNATAVVAPDGLACTLSIAGVGRADQGVYDCAIADAQCRVISTAPVNLFVNSADFNGDGDLGTDGDIDAFFACLGGNCCPTCARADFNVDGDIGTDEDIESFFRVLAGGPC
jgi:probable HAF family extracellular repeat protein